MSAIIANSASASRAALSATYAALAEPVSGAETTRALAVEALKEPLDGNRLTAGEGTLHRLFVSSGGITMTSGVLRLTYFTARKTETTTALRLVSGTQAAAATPTLVRAGIWSVAGNGDLTLVASIPSDTSLLAAANTVYTRSLTASLAKVAGRRYAYGLLVVTAATAPFVYGASSFIAGEMGQSPKIGGTITAQTDLPATLTAAAVADSGGLQYAVLVP
jgi:hypothetical protein